MIAARLRQVAAKRVLWCARCMKTNGRIAWRTVRTDALNKRAWIAARDLGVREGSVAPREDAKEQEARNAVQGQPAATELVTYVLTD